MRTATGKTGYCIVALYVDGADRPSVMACDGRPIVFDNIANAQDVLPAVGESRPITWSADGETAYWPLLVNGKPSRAVILTGYDPFHTTLHGVRSEAYKSRWKHHIHWAEWWRASGIVPKE